MKNMFKFSSLIIALMMVASISAFAQHGPGKGPHGKHGRRMSDSCRVQLRVDDLVKELSLSEKQRKEIETIHYAHISEAKKLHKEYESKNDCVEERNARIQLKEKMDAEVKKVLDNEQKTMYDEFIKERRGPHGKHFGPC
jgi:Spy/CpxP family protein refolding chaperone